MILYFTGVAHTLLLFIAVLSAVYFLRAGQ